MATPSGGRETPIGRGLVDRIAGAAKGAYEGWFGPGQPLAPIAPKQEVEGRQFDYPYGVNLSYAPRQEQGQQAAPFPLLRAIADPAQGGLDLLRLAISKRKRQMSKLKWKIQGRDDTDGGDTARQIEEWFKKPDGYRGFRRWQRMLLEDHFVLDAVAVYPRARTDRVLLEPVDGATLKLVIDEFGRRPLPPMAAYQQFLKSVPATDYTTDELYYYASDERTDRIYGFSRVEQVLNIVTIALNRQLSISSYYTKGSIPEMLLEMPATLSSASQLKEFDEFWQSLLSGQVDQKWRARMIPAGAKAIFAKDAILKDAFDEWLARIICFAFDLPPTSLVKETNRSVSETQKEAAEEEGLESTKQDFKEIMDDLLAGWFDGGAEMEFAYDEEEVVDQEANAKIVVSLYGGTTGTAKPVITLSEARERVGYDVATAEQIKELQPPAPLPEPGGFGGGDKSGDKGGDKGAAGGEGDTAAALASKARKARAGRPLPAPRRNAHAFADAQERLAEHLAPRLHSIGHTLAGVLRHGLVTVGKAEGDDKIARVLAALTPEEWRAIEDVLGPVLADYAKQVATAAAHQAGVAVGATDAELEAMLGQANLEAVAWAAERAAALVKEIDESTRARLRETISSGLAEGFTNHELADAISESELFSAERALLIARTEMANAENAATLTGWKASGVVEGKAWVPDAEACEICLGNEADGVIGLDETFSSGDTEPTAHPNCECTLEAVLAEPGG